MGRTESWERLGTMRAMQPPGEAAPSSPADPETPTPPTPSLAEAAREIWPYVVGDYAGDPAFARRVDALKAALAAEEARDQLRREAAGNVMAHVRRLRAYGAAQHPYAPEVILWAEAELETSR